MIRVLLALIFVLFSLNASSIDEAVKLAKKEHKLIMVEISKKNCPYCKALDRVIFDNPERIAKIKQKYIIVRLKKGRDNIPSFFKIKYYPTTYLMKNDGTIVDEMPGYMKSSDFMEFIGEVYRQEKKFL